MTNVFAAEPSNAESVIPTEDIGETREDFTNEEIIVPVSYTHLVLPILTGCVQKREVLLFITVLTGNILNMMKTGFLLLSTLIITTLIKTGFAETCSLKEMRVIRCV